MAVPAGGGWGGRSGGGVVKTSLSSLRSDSVSVSIANEKDLESTLSIGQAPPCYNQQNIFRAFQERFAQAASLPQGWKRCYKQHS